MDPDHHRLRPGQDDAVNLLLAFASPELDILGITAVAGKLPLEVTSRNVRILCELGGRTDIPVHADCPRPMVLDPITASLVHGRPPNVDWAYDIDAAGFFDLLVERLGRYGGIA